MAISTGTRLDLFGLSRRRSDRPILATEDAICFLLFLLLFHLWFSNRLNVVLDDLSGASFLGSSLRRSLYLAVLAFGRLLGGWLAGLLCWWRSGRLSTLPRRVNLRPRQSVS
jgi:hypothetical protein